MLGFLRRLWSAAPLATALLALALLASGFFAFRTVTFWVYWSDPAHQELAIEPWMPLGYVGRSWQVPREELATSLGLESRTGRPQSIAQIAAERGVPVDELIAGLEAAIAAYRATQPPPADAGASRP